MNEGRQDVELEDRRRPSIKMYLCICGVLLTLGLILFFSYYGLFIIQFVSQKLCLCHEKSTQTDLSQEKTLSQKRGSQDEIDAINKKLEEPELSHEVDLRCPNVKMSLQQVFECAYSQFILTWYSVPEPRNKQPLYIALERQFDTLVDRVIRRASDINFSSIAVDSVRILTQHLHNAKQPDGGQLFSSRTDEIAVLRVFSEALVRNFFPESLTTQDLTRCALNEIVTLKVLQLLVEWLSDPDNLNQVMVSHLDPTTPKNSTDEVQGQQTEDTPSSLDSETKEVIREGTEDANVKPKKKGIKTKFHKLFGKWKITPTKKKRKEKGSALCRQGMSLPDEIDGLIACPAVYQQTFDSVEGDCESSTPTLQEDQTEFKLFYEMWCISRWTVSVKQVQEKDGELSFTISLEEASKPESLNWNVSKSQMDIRLFYCCLQDCANLPSIAELLESKENTMNDKFKQQATATLEAFLQELVKDSQLGQSTEVFRFLCPLEQLLTEESNGEVWSLLRNLAYILTQMGGEEEDVGALGPPQLGDPGTEAMGPEGLAETEAETETETEAEDEDEDEEADLNGSCDGRRCFTAISGGSPSVGSGDSEDSSRSLEEAPLFQAARLPVTCLSEDDPPGRESHSQQDDGGQQYDCTDGFCLSTKAKHRERVEQPNKRELDQSGKGQHDATKAIIDLLKEISGNGIISAIEVILRLKYLRRKVNCILNKINPTEPQIASCIDMLRKKQWPGGVPVDAGPGQTRTREQRRETKDRAHKLINSRRSIAFFLKIDVDAVFKIFQDTEENKKLIYMLLSFLLRELMPGESSLNVKAIAFLNSPA